MSPSRLCGADNAPRQLPASTLLRACGGREACDRTTFELSSVRLEITQNAENLAEGTVVLQGTGDPDLDGQTWPATVDRARVTVSVHDSNLPAACEQRVDLDLDYDFEGFGLQRLEFATLQTPGCAGNPGQYCKGGVSVDLAPAD